MRFDNNIKIFIGFGIFQFYLIWLCHAKLAYVYCECHVSHGQNERKEISLEGVLCMSCVQVYCVGVRNLIYACGDWNGREISSLVFSTSKLLPPGIELLVEILNLSQNYIFLAMSTEKGRKPLQALIVRQKSKSLAKSSGQGGWKNTFLNPSLFCPENAQGKGWRKNEI